MFMTPAGTKEIMDALVMCEQVLAKLPAQKIPRFDAFEDTEIMADYLAHLIEAIEGKRPQRFANVRRGQCLGRGGLPSQARAQTDSLSGATPL